MTEEKKEEAQIPEKKIFGESLGRYSLIDGQRVYQFSFPGNASLEDNFAAICFIKDALLKSIEENAKAEKEKAEKAKEDGLKEKPVLEKDGLKVKE